MSGFSINTAKANAVSQELSDIASKLKEMEARCDDMKKGLNTTNASIHSVSVALARLISQMEEDRISVKYLGEQLHQIVQLYEKAEKEILNVNISDAKIEKIIEKSHTVIREMLGDISRIFTGIMESICAYDGDPVNMCNGSYLDRVVDLDFINGLQLSFIRCYNSVAATNSVMGMGWRHNYEIYLDIKDSELLVTSEIGIERFVLQTDGTYSSNYGNCDVIRKEEKAYVWLRENGLMCWFNEEGQLVRMNDKCNNEIVFRYDDSHLEAAKDQYGNELQYKYNDAGYLIEVCDNTDRSVSFAYEGIFLTKALSVVGKAYTYTYDEMGRLAAYHLPDGELDFSIFYDEESRVVKQIFADQSKLQYEYEEDVVIYTNEKGQKTKYYHDKKGRHVKTKYADSSEEVFEYDQNNHRILKIDRNGASFSRTYDNKGNITHVKDACGYATEYRFGETTGPVYVLHPDGSNVSAEYDEMGNMIQLTDEMGTKTTFSYNQYGQMTYLCRENGVGRSYSYDERGNLCSITDENGYTVSYQYDRYDNIQMMVDANGNVTKYEYRPDRKLVSITNALGQERRVNYDIYGNLIEVVDFDGLTESRSFDCRNRMLSYTDKAGNITRYEYSVTSDLIRVILPNGGIIAHEYDLMGKRIKTTLPDGEVTTYEYNTFGDMVCMRKGALERHYEFNASHLLVKCYDNTGHMQKTSYDFRGHILTLDSENGRDKRYEYDKCGRCTLVEDIMGRRMHYEYDKWGNLIGLTDAVGRKITYEYDAADQLKKVKYPNGNWTTFTYDGNGNLLCKEQQDGYKLCYDYDVVDRTVAVYDNQEHRVKLEYDAAGNVSRRTDGMGNVTTYAYTENGMLKGVTDDMGNTVTYFYDEMNLLREIIDDFSQDGKASFAYDRTLGGKIRAITDVLGNSKSYDYDTHGNMIKATDGQNLSTLYEYDVAGRVCKVVYPDEKTAFFSYDTYGRMLQMSDWNGITSFTYDECGRMLQSINPRGRKLEYSWGQADELRTMVYPDGEKVTYQYDDLLRKTEVSVNDLKVFYEYDENGRLKCKKFNNESVQSYGYNSSGQLVQYKYSDKCGSVVNTVFDYDALGNKIAKEIYNKNGELIESERYTFDAVNRLVEVVGKSSMTTCLKYDSRGNRVCLLSNDRTVDYTYNAANQLIMSKCKNETGEQIIHYAYDHVGNLCAKESNGRTKGYNFDARGRLAEIYEEGMLQATYVYDALGNRLCEHKVLEDILYKKDYTIDYLSPLQRIVGIETAEQNCNYLWEDVLLGSFSDETQYYICDELGSVVGVEDAKGDVLQKYAYTSFGENVNISWENDEITEKSPFGFTGYLRETADELYYAYAREYMPGIGRFVMQDSHQYMYIDNPQSLNLYHYCLNNPVVFVDPSGNDCYIFYLPEWKNEAKNDRRQLAKEYDCSLDEIHLIPITDSQSMTDGWNAMGMENGKKVDIDCVVINSHANPFFLGFGNSSGALFGASDIAALDNKDVEKLVLYGCNAGHADYSTTNPAAEFSKKVNGAPVLASDGTVYSGLTFFNLTNRNYRSKADKHFKEYLINGKRKNNGWMVYQYENGIVNTTVIGEKKMSITEMTRTLEQYLPVCSRRTS